MIALDDVKEFSTRNMPEFVKNFRMHKANSETELINNGRLGLSKIIIEFPVVTSNEFEYKTRVYRYPGLNFIPITLEFTEPDIKKNINIDLEIITLDQLFNKLYLAGSHKTVDLYFDGVKQNAATLKVIYDYDNLILISTVKPRYITCIIRDVVRDFYSTNTKITIPVEYKSIYSKYYKLVFSNGMKTNNFTVNVLSNGDTQITVNDSGCKESQLILLPECTIQTVVPNGNWIDIRPNSKLSINIDNILIFMNGTLLNLKDSDYLRKGNSIFKITAFNNYSKDLIIVHQENTSELIQTYGSIDWYRDNINKDVVKALNNNNAPSFVSSYSNFNKDISADSSYMCNLDSYDFNANIIKDLIKYDAENFKNYIEGYLNKRDNFSYSVYINAAEYDYTKHVKTNNKDVPSSKQYTEFGFPMVLFRLSNPDYKPFKVYVDGIALYRNMEYYNSMGETYLYIRLNKFLLNTVVEVEFYNIDTERYDEQVMINADGIYKLPENKKKSAKNLIDIYKVADDDTHTKLETFDYDSNTGTINIGKNKSGLYRIIINNAIVFNEYVVNSRKLEVVEFDMPNHKFSKYDPEYYRVYKNGRLIPRKHYQIQFPDASNKRTVPFIHLDCQCFMSEQINVEYVPYRMKEVNSQDIIDEFGRIKLEKSTLQYPIGLLIDSIYLNGRKMNTDNIIQQSSTGFELKNIYSRKNFCILLKEDYDNYTNFKEFTNSFQSGNSAFDSYIKDAMVGSRIDDREQSILEKDYNIMRELYWDLYNEYLKYAIVDFGNDIPNYIAIKYSDLVDFNNFILIDSSEQMNHWMPLDASKTSEEIADQLLDTYNTMVDKLSKMDVIEPYEMSTDEINKIMPLVKDKVIAIDLSEK